MHPKDPRLTKKDASYIITKSERISKEKPCHKQGKGLLFAVPENETKLGMAGVHALKKSKLAHRGGPSCRFINRAPIFYSSSFTCHAGLPANRIFNIPHCAFETMMIFSEAFIHFLSALCFLSVLAAL